MCIHACTFQNVFAKCLLFFHVISTHRSNARIVGNASDLFARLLMLLHHSLVLFSYALTLISPHRSKARTVGDSPVELGGEHENSEWGDINEWVTSVAIAMEVRSSV
jgi:hypothetical protein